MLEIILVAVAWSKGWKWRALIPVIIAYVLVFSLMAGLGENALGPVIFVAICELVALGVMASTQPYSAYKPKTNIATNITMNRENISTVDDAEVQEHSLVNK